MTSAIAHAQLPEDPHIFVSSDISALALHMNVCKQSQGHFFALRSTGDFLRVLVSSRIVSTGALMGAAALAMWLYFP